MTEIKKYRQLFYIEKVPTLQNTVYPDPASARKAPFGRLNILQDKETGFAFNADFREDLLQYDQSYDNSVPSKVFMDYYDEIADYLVENYDLKNGVVIDVGCGKGSFLSRLAQRHEFVTGVGIDPSYEGALEALGGRLQFKKAHFSEEHLRSYDNVAIIVCRHVLEHIPSPSNFLRQVLEPVSKLGNIPLFVEVPDLTWIVENNAFWDFCYEHVNYFNHASLHRCIAESGAEPAKITSAFGDQYIWAEAVVNPSRDEFAVPSGNSIKYSDQNGRSLAISFKENLEVIAAKVRTVALSKDIVIWGMATKGVMYSLHLLNLGVEVAHCVDINERKQGKYCPLSGLKIQSPLDLQKNKPYAIIAMNPNYAAEIESQCRDLGLRVVIYTPDIDAALG